MLRPPAWPSARALSHWLWYGRSVRAQLLIVFILIDVIAGLIAGAVTILQARTSTRIEIAASMELAELLVSEAVGLMQQEVPAEKFLFDLTVAAAAGAARADRGEGRPRFRARGAAIGRQRRRDAGRARAGLVCSADRRADRKPRCAGGRQRGAHRLGRDRRRSRATRSRRSGSNTVALGAVALIVNIAVIAILYFLFGRVLDPLTGVARGLADLEQRNYRVRLPRPRAQELAAITDRFNALAQALDAARSENEKLNHRLITAQDDERRRTALELHDEVGPSLFGLKANAGSIATAAAELPEQVARKMTARVRDMLAIIEHLQSINRSMLNRLRPMALGHVPLHDILAELVRERARQLPRDRVRVFRPQAHARLRRFGRSHGLSLRAGKPDQRHPPRAGKACRRGARRSRKRGKRERRTGACAHRA